MWRLPIFFLYLCISHLYVSYETTFRLKDNNCHFVVFVKNSTPFPPPPKKFLAPNPPYTPFPPNQHMQLLVRIYKYSDYYSVSDHSYKKHLCSLSIPKSDIKDYKYRLLYTFLTYFKSNIPIILFFSFFLQIQRVVIVIKWCWGILGLFFFCAAAFSGHHGTMKLFCSNPSCWACHAHFIGHMHNAQPKKRRI